MMKNKHYSALLNKNITVQLRKKKTTISFLVFIGLQLISLIGIELALKDTSFTPEYYNNTNIFNVPPVDTCYFNTPQLCYPWYYGWYAAALPSQANLIGSLPNSTEGHSGLLGNIKQLKYESNIVAALVPFFSPKKASEIDNQIMDTYSYISKQMAILQKENPNNYYNNISYTMLSMLFPSAVLIFNDFSVAERSIDYTVQVPITSFWDYANIFMSDYVETAMFSINMISNAFLQSVTTNMNVSIETTFINFPEEQSSIINFDIASLIGGYFIPFALGLPQVLHLFFLVSEKHERQLEMMKMMGMRASEYWITTYIFGYLMYLVVAVPILACYVIFQFSVIANQSNPLTYLLIFFLHGHAQVSLTMLLSCFFWRPVTALVFCIVLNLFSVSGVASISSFVFMKMPSFLLLIAPISLTRAWAILSVDSIQTPLLPVTAFYLDRYSLLMETFVFMILSTFLCVLLALYLDKVLPREHGVNKSLLFPFISLRNKLKNKTHRAEKEEKRRRREEKLPLVPIQDDIDDVSIQTDDEDCERERKRALSDEPLLMKIVDLTKKYPKSDKFSLFGVSLALEQGDCLGLLGPNGAGKTTLISMLCGLTKPTSGDALVLNHSILSDIQGVHELIGFCPQQDILWPDLTVEEHLLFYCALKNHGGDIAYLHVQRLAAEIGLSGEHLHKRVSQLSAGMKRRLATGIALVGSSRVVLLDEPTSGLDHVARRAVWDIIERQKKAGRTFIITTHDMSEADVLCSRIAIISQGRMQKLGSPAHLKAKFGSGYNLKLFVDTKYSLEKIQSYFAKFLPNAVLTNQEPDALEFMINDQKTNLGEVSALLEQNSETLNILEWSINPTSLEQVFLQLAHNDEIKE